MVDITELKELEDKAFRTEEIRLLGEISARFAHEIRNPLATAGGFARRLRDALPENTKNREFASIIVEEVARLEGLLKIMLSSLEPFPLSITMVHLNSIIEAFLVNQKDQISAKGLVVETSLSTAIPGIQGDEKKLTGALENLFKCAILSASQGERIFIQTYGESDKVFVILRHKSDRMGDEDVEQFFFPRVTAECDTVVQGLPLSKIIIHRHGGKIDVSRERDDIFLKIELPTHVPD
jgi:nitrogen-specific signal transduction histidine kinase